MLSSIICGTSDRLLLQALVPKQAGFVTHKTRLVQIGEAAGRRSRFPRKHCAPPAFDSPAQGDVPGEAVPEATRQIWRWMKEGKLTMDTEQDRLKTLAKPGSAK